MKWRYDILKPNIIIFNPDQMRADSMGHLGNRASITPNLDRIIEKDGVSFRNAFCQNPVCVPSRCSFLTGTYPHVKGHRTMSYMLQEDEKTLLSELKDNGYFVWMNGRNDFLPAQVKGVFEKHATETFYGGDVKEAPGLKNPGLRGGPGSKHFYSFYFGELELDENGKNYTVDDEAVDKAIEKINESKEEQPFCIFLGLQLPHPPYQIEEPFFSSIDKEKMKKRVFSEEGLKDKPSILKIIAKEQHLEELTEDDWDEIRKCYLAMCMKTDYLFGKLCDALKEKGIYDNTAIFVFSDHGDYTGDYGIVEKTQNTFEDCLVKVPFIVKPPAGYEVDAGISDSLVELVDLYPTVMEMCGISPSHSHFGNSLVPLIQDRKMKNKDFVFSEGGRLKSEKHCDENNGVMPHPFNPYYPRKTAQLDDVAHTKATMIRSDKYKYIKRLYEMDEFYDLVKDPDECKNEISNPEYSCIINDMRMEMLEWFQTTTDIVPYGQDERFNYDMIWNRVKMNVPESHVEEVQQKIRDGVDMFQLIEYVKRLNA